MDEVSIERWDGSDWRVTVEECGPVGETLSQRDAEVVKRWLPTALHAIHAERDAWREAGKKVRGAIDALGSA